MSLQINEQDLQNKIDSINKKIENVKRFQEYINTEIPKIEQEVDEWYASLDEETKLKLKQQLEQITQSIRFPKAGTPEDAELKQKIENYSNFLANNTQLKDLNMTPLISVDDHFIGDGLNLSELDFPQIEDNNDEHRKSR